jgi:acetyltransferase
MLNISLLDPEAVTLKDGTPVIIRPIRPEDADHLQDTFDHLSMATIYLRFLSFKKELPDEEARYLATVDYDSRMAFVALCQKNGRDIIIGVARYALLDIEHPKMAESAVVVQDEYQHRGLGKILLRKLVLYAHSKGIHHLRGNLQVGNNRMLDLVKNSGLAYKTRFVDGIWQVDIDVARLKENHG